METIILVKETTAKAVTRLDGSLSMCLRERVDYPFVAFLGIQFSKILIYLFFIVEIIIEWQDR